MRIEALSGWTSEQRHVVAATFLVLETIARDFGTHIEDVTLAITLTLAMRPIGAYIFGLSLIHI